MQLYVRRHYFFPPSRLTTYYEGVSAEVRAESQVCIPMPALLDTIV